MIRGVKKQIIEVMNTENEYFEKAILVVSDKFAEADRSRLNKKATEYVSSINPFPVVQTQNEKSVSDRVSKFLGVIKYLLACAVGAMTVYFVVR